MPEESRIPDGLCPLEQVLLAFLQQQPQGVSEHLLLTGLRNAGFPEFARPPVDELDLFRQHFLLFHHLYRLAEALRGEGRNLDIHCLCIRMRTHTSSGDPRPADPDGLAAYYLDLTHLNDTSAEDVQEMIYGGSRRLEAADAAEQALDVLGLPADAKLAAIRERYRLLARKHHPDRGGDGEYIKDLNHAWTILSRLHGG